MGRERTPMKKIREILRLHELGMSLRKISVITGVSRPVVSEYIDNLKTKALTAESIEEIADSNLKEILGYSGAAKKERFQKLREYFPKWQLELAKIGVTLQLLWGEYRVENPTGYSRSQCCYHFNRWQKDSKVSMHIEHKAGDKMFVDFAGDTIPILDPSSGQSRPAEVFVAILGASQLTFVCAVNSQKKEEFIRANQQALEYFGGVPQAIVPDCLKSGVTKGDKYEPEINIDYDDFAQYYNTVILPARPYKPKDKAYVENAVRLTYQRIFAPLRNEKFDTLEALNQAILPLLEKHNNSLMKVYNASRRDLFNEIEKSVLKPLPLTPYEISKGKMAKVAFNYHVYLGEDNHYYSVPYRFCGQVALIRYNHNVVSIFIDHVRVAVHERSFHKGKYTTKPDHMPPNHKWRDNWSPERLLSWAESIGPHVGELVKIILEKAKYQEQAFKTCMGILNIPKGKYSKSDLNLACKRALHFSQYSYKAITNILQKNLHQEVIEPDPDLFGVLPAHENLRGGSYYTMEETL